jgi:acyl carrier protein
MSIDTARDGTRSAVAAAIALILRTEPVDLTESTRLIEDLGMDSSAVFGVLMELEDALGFAVNTDTLRLRDLATVGSLTDYVTRCRQP